MTTLYLFYFRQSIKTRNMKQQNFVGKQLCTMEAVFAGKVHCKNLKLLPDKMSSFIL